MKSSIFVIGLLISSIGWGQINEMDRLEYQNQAREASNRKFLALVELGAAKGETTSAQYSYDLALKLVERKVVSAFDFSNASMKLMQAKFAVQRAQYHLEAAAIYEQIANLRVAAIESGKENPQEQARLNLELSQKRNALLEQLDLALVPFTKEIDFQFKSSENLLSKGAVSPEEFQKMKVLHDDVLGLVSATKTEFLESQKQQTAAAKEIK